MPSKTEKSKPAYNVGFGKQDITPPLPFPMAGIAVREGRPAKSVHDPLWARALAFFDGTTTAVVLSADLLLISEPLRDAVHKTVTERGGHLDGLLITATHTHSSTGGYLDRDVTKLFMGPFDPDIEALLVNGMAVAVLQALEDLSPSKIAFGEVQTEGLNYNRRHKLGPIDRTLGVLSISRREKDIQVVTFGAHPVVAAFRDYNAASADYPGELIREIEKGGDHAMFIVGPVGAVNVLYPEGPMELDVHLRLLKTLFMEKIDQARQGMLPTKGTEVAFAYEEVTLTPGYPKLFVEGKEWADILAFPLRIYLHRFAKKSLGQQRRARVLVLRVGDLIITGFPADLGAGVGLAAKEIIAKSGLRTVVVASQTDDYVGYVHMPPDYSRFEWDDKDARWMTIYENAMAFTGRDTGTRLIEAFSKALDKVKPQ